jgi:hypothetical protein
LLQEKFFEKNIARPTMRCWAPAMSALTRSSTGRQHGPRTRATKGLHSVGNAGQADRIVGHGAAAEKLAGFFY